MCLTVSVGITRHSQGLPVVTGTQERKGLIKTMSRESQTIIRPLRDSLGKVFQRPREQCQTESPMKDGNEGLGGCLLQKDSCSPAAPVSMYCCQAGMEGHCCRMPQPWLLCLHISCSRHRICRLLAVQVLLASLAFPTLASSPDFLGVPKQREESGLSTMALEAAAGKPASSSSVIPTDKLHSTLRDDLVTKAGLSCFLEQDSSEAPGTFLTVPSSRL